jgi:hypothetical protein
MIATNDIDNWSGRMSLLTRLLGGFVFIYPACILRWRRVGDAHTFNGS